eukprot:CAMPEP_0198229188 /NCGR_PEP_ID=MMETSP1445-20131203/113992_1 /TAXON_ID=36898 /ORGANISM="Pyramimonas sp., Strain CCMP2087" /LENGTH=255 /DNA_ID=CAMNT_0043909635 /DNA_START=716 /DNA_END=1483 /DNA_ORIENTATION=-
MRSALQPLLRRVPRHRRTVLVQRPVCRASDGQGNETKIREAEKLDPLLWKDQTRWVELVKGEASMLAGLGRPSVAEEEVEERLNQLATMLPDLVPALSEFYGPQIITRLCADMPGLFMRLIALRSLFPDSNVSRMVVRSKLWLVDSATSMEMVEVVRSRFTKEHPNVEMDRILQEFPWLLNLADVQHIVKMSNPVEFQRAYGQDSVGKMLSEADVNSILGFKQRLVNQLEGPNIVPFDKIVTRGYGGYGGGMYGR